GMDEVRLARRARLPLVLDRGEDVRLAQQLEVRPRMMLADGLVDVFEADHRPRERGRRAAGGASPHQFRGGPPERQGNATAGEGLLTWPANVGQNQPFDSP